MLVQELVGRVVAVAYDHHWPLLVVSVCQRLGTRLQYTRQQDQHGEHTAAEGEDAQQVVVVVEDGLQAVFHLGLADGFDGVIAVAFA